MRVYLDYKILIAKKAQKILENLDIVERTKIVVKVKLLNTENIKTLNIKKLQGYKDLYRLRVDDFRVIYKVYAKGKLLIVAVVGQRKNIYHLIKRSSL
ncbi:MAG: plasmid stabilization protein [Epsilonproteobacteria bacterium]|nr:plasmid stabilization protein [Campylobacterota bacterium]|tara:strand:- start:509 stop:802 length:294 start_codon:yes stop_codon:yes gene_type:complete